MKIVWLTLMGSNDVAHATAPYIIIPNNRSSL
jgi:hypothetical protein